MGKNIYEEIDRFNEESNINEEIKEIRERKEEEAEKEKAERAKAEEEKKKKREAELAERKKRRDEFEKQLSVKFEEFIRSIITSKDERLDQIVWIKTLPYDEYTFSYLEGKDVDKPITVREALLIRKLDKPYVYMLVDGPMRDQYENKIDLHPNLDEEQLVKAKRYIDKKNIIKNLSISSTGTSLDEPGAIEIDGAFFDERDTIDDFLNDWPHQHLNGEYKDAEFYPRIDGRILIHVTQRELLQAGLDPRDFEWKSLEQIKNEQVTTRDIAEADLEKGLTKKETKGIGGIIEGIRKYFKDRKEKREEKRRQKQNKKKEKQNTR